MLSRLTMDTSVFISRLRKDDVAHAKSQAFLEALPGRPLLTILPTLVRPEIAGMVRRFSGDAQLGRRALEVLDPLPNLNLVALDARLADDAAQLAADHGMKAADAVHVAVAQLFDATLVTLDLQQADRASSVVRAMGPEEALAAFESA